MVNLITSGQNVNCDSNSVGGVAKVLSFDGGGTIIPNKAATDKRLSFAAEGALTRLASLPHDWTFRLSWFAAEYKISEPTARKLINELIEHGYGVRWRMRGPDGKLGAVVYVFSADPRLIEHYRSKVEKQGGSPQAKRPRVAKPSCGKVSATNTTLDKNTKEQTAPLPPSQPEILDRTEAINKLANAGLKRGPRPSIDPELLKAADGLGVPVAMIEAGIRGPNVTNPSGLFRAHSAKWICEQLPKLDPALAKSAMAGRGTDYRTVLNLMTLRLAARA